MSGEKVSLFDLLFLILFSFYCEAGRKNERVGYLYSGEKGVSRKRETAVENEEVAKCRRDTWKRVIG